MHLSNQNSGSKHDSEFTSTLNPFLLYMVQGNIYVIFCILNFCAIYYNRNGGNGFLSLAFSVFHFCKSLRNGSRRKRI